jgi:hypothetical protein
LKSGELKTKTKFSETAEAIRKQQQGRSKPEAATPLKEGATEGSLRKGYESELFVFLIAEREQKASRLLCVL